MKPLITICLLAMITGHAQAQTAKRLIGYSRYDNGVLQDSAWHKYRSSMGSHLTTYFSYQGYTQHALPEYFDAADPQASQVIQSDSSVYLVNDGSGLVISRIITSGYDGSRNLTHTLNYTPDETFERFVTMNGLGLRETVIERDSGDGSLPYVDRLKHYFTYDNQNRILADSVHDLVAAAPFSKANYSYNSAGLPTEYIRYSLLNGSPEQEYKIEWAYDGSNRLITVADFDDFGSGWQPTNRFTYAYTGAAAHYTILTAESRGSSSPPVLVNQFREIYELNSAGQPETRYWLQFMGGAWDTLDRYTIHHNSAGLYDYMEGAEYLGGGTYGPVNLFQYFYYEDYITTGIAETSKPATGFTIYPNPATDQLTIAFDSPLKADADLIIYNLQGQIIKCHSEQSGTWISDIDLSALPSGRYVLQSTIDPANVKTFLITR